MKPLKVLFPVLNWGLGHATRSLPVIQQVIKRGHRVTLASDGEALHLLRRELPKIPWLALPSYQITYPLKADILQQAKMAYQIRRAVRNERDFLNKCYQEKDFDIVISDNRYGVFHPNRPSVIITHQLNLALPTLQKRLSNFQIRNYLERFHYCWIPDDPMCRLSGTLSQGKLNIPTEWIGLLSRLSHKEVFPTSGILTVLSGPEPHRSLLQKELITKLTDLNLAATIVLGTNDQAKFPNFLPAHIKCFSILTSDQLNEMISGAEFVICRSGYSSIMDLIKVNKPALLVPTPGQPEQEYLGHYLSDKQQFVIQEQGDLDVQMAAKVLAERKWVRAEFESQLLEKALDQLGL